MPYWSFNEYAENRDLTEAGMLKNWKNRILGRDADNNSNLATAHAMRHKDDAIGAATGVGRLANNAAGLAGNIATGNVFGAAESIWKLISGAVSTGTKAYKAAGAALYVVEVRKHMAELKKHLAENEDLDDETVDAIIDAVFEVDTDLFGDVGEKTWAEGTKRFATGLAGGYDNIGNKIFAAVMAQVIREWVERMGGKVEGMQETIAKLRGEKAQKIDFLNEPEIADAMAEFDPPRVEKDLEQDVKQAPPGTPRTIGQLESKVVQMLKWPKIPQNGDIGYASEEGHDYCIGPITLNDSTIVDKYDLDTIAKWGWDFWWRNFSVQGKIKVNNNSSCRWREPTFGYEARGSSAMKWDAAKRMWHVHFDPD